MLREFLLSVGRGFAMGAADIVPGVSGGTIALVLGIYERFVASIRAGSSAIGHLLKGDWRGVRRWLGEVEWLLIIPLGIGVIAAILSLAHLIEQLLHDEAVAMSALFFGLVAGSIVIAWGMLKRATPAHIAIAVGVGVVLFMLLGLREGTSDDTVGQMSEPMLWAFFGSGALAICAMILPGISGSFILVMLGMYEPVLSAVTDRDFAALGAFTLGAIVGLALFSQILHWALRHHHDVVLAALIGLMLGSFRVLWPWPDGVESTALHTPDGDVVLAIVAAAIGFVAVVILSVVARRLESVDHADLADT